MIDEPFNNGARAYHEYRSRDENPYDRWDDENNWWAWDNGYSSAKNGYVDENGSPK